MSKASATFAKDNTIIMNRLAIVLKEERITNRSLASQIGYKETTVSKWATNSVQPPLSTFYRIALLLNRDLQELVISTKNISEADRSGNLKILAEMGEKGKKINKKGK
jgi:transcriptional regulator with XRE-family HTH domain